MRALLARLRSLGQGLRARGRIESEMDEEIRFHLDCRAADLVRAGMAPEEAARRARVEFGGVEGIKEERRAARGLRLLDEARGDFRYALRSYRRTPGLAAIVIATLAVVVGLGGLGFALVEALLLRPLPVPAPDLAVFDCRFSLADPSWGRQAYQLGHIVSALFADLEGDLSSPHVAGVTGRHPLPDRSLLTRRMSEWGIDEHVQIVAYDDAGGAIAARMWWLAGWLGHRAVAVLDGGWQAWLAAIWVLTIAAVFGAALFDWWRGP